MFKSQGEWHAQYQWDYTRQRVGKGTFPSWHEAMDAVMAEIE